MGSIVVLPELNERTLIAVKYVNNVPALARCCKCQHKSSRLLHSNLAQWELGIT